MKIQYLVCRDEGHKFETSEDHDIHTKGRRLISYKRTTTCRCCGTTRTQEIDGGTFEVIKNTYWYPEGYLVGDGERITRRDARRQVFEHYHD